MYLGYLILPLIYTFPCLILSTVLTIPELIPCPVLKIALTGQRAAPRSPSPIPLKIPLAPYFPLALFKGLATIPITPCPISIIPPLTP